MSEYSESYHLRSNSADEAIALLQLVGLSGFVFPPQHGWVSFVAEGAPFRPNLELIEASEGLLLHWAHGEDHGWGFELYRDGEQVISHYCSWDDDELVVHGDINVAALEEELGFPVLGLHGEVEQQVFQPQAIDQVRETMPACAFAAAIGLVNFKCLSFNYLEGDVEKGHPLPGGVQAA